MSPLETGDLPEMLDSCVSPRVPDQVSCVHSELWIHACSSCGMLAGTPKRTRKFRSIPIFSSPPFLLFLPGKGKDIKMILWKLLVLKMEVGTENNGRKKRAGTLRFGQNFCVDRYCLLPNF